MNVYFESSKGLTEPKNVSFWSQKEKPLALTTDYEVPTWSQIYDMLLSQAQKIRSQRFKPDLIVGIARGGLVPARILTDLLETQELSFVQIKFYNDINRKDNHPTLIQSLTTQTTGKSTLLVDDIADTGESLKLASTYLQTQGAFEVKTATIYQKPQSKITPDFSEKQTSAWVVFPWDTKETLRKIAQKHQGKRSLNLEVAKLVKAGLSKQIAEKLLKDFQ